MNLLRLMAPMLISALRESAKETETKIDDFGVDIIEVILKKFGIIK
jgi:hypothetical protein